MPYYVHEKLADPPERYDSKGYPSFTVRADGFAYLKENHSAETHTITFVATTNELLRWSDREKARLRSGDYVNVPWKDSEPYEYVNHFAHLSVAKPGMVAYTPDEEHGVTDRQVRLTPGRYLERFYADRFSREEIAGYIASVSADFSEFQIATSTEDIRKVYRHGPSSCMGGPTEHTDQYWKERQLNGHRPIDVYASPSDLAVAYFGPIDKPSQRSVIWPANKIYGRIYGSGPLETLLLRADYENGSFDGARILNIEVHGGYLMPYVDGVDYAREVSSRFLRLGEGPIDAQPTKGYSQGEDETVSCDRCHSAVDADETEDGLCESCQNDRWDCHGCDRTYYADETQTTIGDYDYCESCTADRTETCQDENCSNTWINDNDFTRQEIATRRRNGVDDLCSRCADRYRYCDQCGEAFDPSVDSEDTVTCPTCGREPRCEKTGDLLSAIVSPIATPVETATPVATRFPDRYATPREIGTFEGGCGDLASAIRNGSWRLASEPGQCLISRCHATIDRGDLFLLNPQGFAYCHRCAVTQSADHRYSLPALPAWTIAGEDETIENVPDTMRDVRIEVFSDNSIGMRIDGVHLSESYTAISSPDDPSVNLATYIRSLVPLIHGPEVHIETVF